MEDQSACTGEDLLDVFKALNINLLNVNPNTIRAWFDTDDKNMKSLLEWMCTSLSAKNYVSPLEYDEFSKLENPLKDDKYETEVERIETEHPSIFSIEDTELDIELLEYELEHLDDEEMLLDQALAINRYINTLSAKEDAAVCSRFYLALFVFTICQNVPSSCTFHLG
ncbi:unnamed protein product [Acanthoscelides obtectus]|uniref:Uncharacterized protein n=1 Tax=Acanthoscelides obtectus TaxID=200917 RepID=A0A9P0LIW3_ACAOB|nr:unnamed protein product [Acanthoscelides obtectus]CAK1634976.1 hypothetical protein AOBTE_LOCUS8982 [Acanthoscelides obtectus]